MFACTHSVDRRAEGQRTIPIGKPLSNTTCYVLDRQGRPQPIGVPGELWIGGDGVARGYLNRPELTAERFVENPLVPGERLYRSGDLVRWSPEGELEYLGRIDEQVKIRGHRIELGEIESRLLEHPSVEEAVLVARRDEAGHSFLAAYLTGQSVADADLRRHLSETLPEYMVPSSFIFLEALPLTPNGKVDKRALPEPATRSEEQSSPATETERALARIWAEVLGRETGVNEHFFEVGGHSLKAMVLTARIHKELGKEVPLSEVFARPTIREMAAWMDDQEQRVASEIRPVGEREHYPVSAAQRRMYIAQQLEGEQGVSYNVPLVIEMIGELDADRLEAVFRRLIDRHESLRTSFHQEDGELVQRVHPSVDWSMERVKAKSREEVDRKLQQFIRPFDLAEAPLIRVVLIQRESKKHVLYVDLHHIISDGVSTNVILRDVILLYKGEELLPVKIQYKDFACWEKERPSEIDQQGAHYWKKQFSDGVPVLELPTDFSRPPIQSHKGRTLPFTVPANLMKQVYELGQEEQSTLFMTLLAAYNVLLFRYTAQEDIVVGTPVAGRPHADLEETVGVFINILPLRNYPLKHLTFREFLRKVKERVLGAYEHADYSFHRLVENLELERDLSRHPLFDTMLNLQNFPIRRGNSRSALPPF